nr:alpha/beta hydrolase [Pseudoglutamicibacter cumminsii]
MRTWVYPAVKATSSTRTFLAIHGFRGDHHGLRRVINAMPEHTWVVPDLPGYGVSTPFGSSHVHDDSQARHTAHGFHAVIDALIDVLELSPDTVLLGHSFGSVVTSTYMAAKPGRFARLILVNPISEPPLAGRHIVLTQATRLLYELGTRVPARWRTAVLSSPALVDGATITMTTSKDRATRDYIRHQHRAYMSGFASPEVLLETYESSVRTTVLDAAADVDAPTLLIAGAGDPLGTVASQTALEALFPNARLVMIPRVGHLIHYETPQTAAQAMRDWLSGSPTAR